MKNEQLIVCKNVFKSESNEKRQKSLTDKWTNLINIFENSKRNDCITEIIDITAVSMVQ